MVLLYFRVRRSLYVNPRQALRDFEGPQRLLPPYEGDIRLLGVLFLFRGPSKYNSGMF